MKKPTICPICGSKVKKVMHAVTRNSYFKCTNIKCHFALGVNYTETELNLQGTLLTSECLKCGKKLEVANGPHGLYGRCFNCNCDITPTKYQGKLYIKYANAYRNSVKEEVETLINNYQKGEADKEFDFEANIAIPTKESTYKSKEPQKGSAPYGSLVYKVTQTLSGSISTPMSCEDISKKTNISLSQARSTINKLKKFNKVKVVGYLEEYAKPTMLYQLIESSLPEVEVMKWNDEYTSITQFIKDNHSKYGNATKMRHIINAGIKKYNIKSVVTQDNKGFVSSFKKEELTQIMEGTWKQSSSNEQLKLLKEAPQKSPDKSSKVISNNILQLMREDLGTPWSCTDITKKLNGKPLTVQKVVNDLLKARKIKIVGLKERKGTQICTYQTIQSSIPKLKITKDTKSYMTINSFYEKRLRGKRALNQYAIREKVVKTLEPTPLIQQGRMYIGYSTAELENLFRDELGSSNRKKKIKRTANLKKRTPIETKSPVPQKTKSLFGFFSSLFIK